MLTQARLKELLHYNPDTGIFTSLVNVNKRKIGDVVGNADKRGYVRVRVGGFSDSAHRLAFLYMTGEFPKHTVDHKNEIKSDNRWDNLRDITDAQNKQNKSSCNRNNASGFLGVSYMKRDDKYYAGIRVNGKVKFLGSYDTPELAHAAYLAEKKIAHPSYISSH